MKNLFIAIIITFSFLYSEPILHSTFNKNWRDDPMEERATGYLLKGVAKTAMSNYGGYINWGEFPNGLWGEYTYIPKLALMFGVPGYLNSSNMQWWDCTENYDSELLNCSGLGISIWCSEDAYLMYSEHPGDQVVVFEVENDRGIVGQIFIVNNTCLENCCQPASAVYGFDTYNENLRIYLDNGIDPNLASAKVGLAYPWSIRPTFSERLEDYDQYNYGADDIPWTDDDEYMYYGANTAESWFSRMNGGEDWQASIGASINTHNLDVTAGELFGNTPFTDQFNISPLLAHSAYPETWPTDNNGSFWPGWWADEYYGDQPDIWEDIGITNCNYTLADPDCWAEVEGSFVSDMDVYMEFDDRWAHRGNMVSESQYQQTGYPMGLRVMTTGHSYADPDVEDVIFFTLKVRNESGNWCAFEKDESGNQNPVLDDEGLQICGSAMQMPDGSTLNNGIGFNYRKASIGFYFDADILTSDINGSFGVHTNDDDFMSYIDCKIPSEFYPEGECPYFNGQELRVSMATIYDYDGVSNGVNSGMTALQILDTPNANEIIDLNQDGVGDIYPGEPLHMTDFHWFDWYNRPGVVTREGSTNCCAGDPGKPQALNKEEIMYKIMSGDTTNLTEDEKVWFFHTDNPTTDLDVNVNPHFDSLEGLTETEFFQNDPDGLDCLFMMSSGPFDIDVGEQISFSFALIYGEDVNDLIDNAEISQKIYNNHYKSLDSCPNLGDMNSDGGWNVLDIVTLANCVLDNNCADLDNSCAGDINGDGGYNVLDIVTLANCVLNNNCADF